MKELTVKHLGEMPEGTVIFDRYNDKLYRTRTGWRYSDIDDDGSYLETGSASAIRLWGPMTLEYKDAEWHENIAVSNAQYLIDSLTEMWDEADRNTQNLMIEMLHKWYLERVETPPTK